MTFAPQLADSSSETLDWRGMLCPAPIINTAKAARKLKGQPGVFRILADDPAFGLDIESWCRSSKAELVEIRENDGSFEAVVSVNGGAQAAPAPRKAAPAPAPRRAAPAATSQPSETLDCRGMLCPAPIINTSKSIRKMAPGGVLEILADDPAFPMDIKSWARSAKAELLTFEEQASGGFRAVVKKEGGAPEPVASSTPAPAPKSLTPAAKSPRVSSARTEITIDLAGLDAASRVERLSALDRLGMADTAAHIQANDPAFTQEVVTWCGQAGHRLVSLDTLSQPMSALVELNENPQVAAAPATGNTLPVLASQANTDLRPDQATLLVLHNDFEVMLAALMVANAAAAAGKDVNIFFSFWGVNLLRGDKPRQNEKKEKISFFQKAFKWMMPKGPKKQQLGQLNFGGIGTGILNGIMKKQNIMNMQEQVQASIDLGVTFTVCTMSMGVMGITKRDLAELPNIVYGGVASFVDDAQGAGLSLVF